MIIIDDNTLNIAVLESYCKKAQVNYYSFSSSSEFVSNMGIIKKEDEYICLIDLYMPLIDGFELGRRIRAVHKSIKIVAVTGADKDSVRDAALLSGINEVVEKPIAYKRFEQLLVAV